MRPKMKLFPVKFRRISEVLHLPGLQKKFWVHFTIYASKNEAVACEIQMPFRSFPPARFREKVLGAISRFMHLKAKLFSVKFRRIWKVLAL